MIEIQLNINYIFLYYLLNIWSSGLEKDKSGLDNLGFYNNLILSILPKGLYLWWNAMPEFY